MDSVACSEGGTGVVDNLLAAAQKLKLAFSGCNTDRDLRLFVPGGRLRRSLSMSVKMLYDTCMKLPCLFIDTGAPTTACPIGATTQGEDLRESIDSPVIRLIQKLTTDKISHTL